MSQKINLMTCSLTRLRIIVPFWSDTLLVDGLKAIRATQQKPERELTIEEEKDLVRKQTVLFYEAETRASANGFSSGEGYWRIDKSIGHHTHTEPMKLRKR